MFCNYSLSLYFPYNFGQPNHFKHLKINVIKTANVVLVNTSKTTFRQIFFLTRTILSSKQKPRSAQKKTKDEHPFVSPLSTTDLTAKIRLFSARSSSNTDPTWMGNTISAPC